MPSLRQAINDKCKECIYDPHAVGAGTYLDQIRNCTSVTCPLYPVRPGSKTRGRRGPKKLSPEHIRKMQEGRKRAKNLESD